MSRINKSFKLDSEPVLIWPKGLPKLVRLKGFKLNYNGTGVAYALHPEKTASVEMVECDRERGWVAWKEIFSDPQLQPNGLLALAKLHANFTAPAVCEWVSRNGLLGFRQVPDPVIRPYHFIPCYVDGGISYYYSEPIDCMRSAAQRAANVLQLWSALKASYMTGQERGSDIRSIVTFDATDSYEHRQVRLQRPFPKSRRDWPKFAATLRKEEGIDSEQVDAGLCYRVFVNGERRSQRPIPKSPRDWRKLANVLLAEYIQEHIQGEVRVSLGIQKQNKDEEEQDRNTESPPDWNLKPTWHIEAALTAYYIELLMVMRRFRSCKVCGNDISHQKTKSLYCGDSSTCRTVAWHRQKAAKRKAVQALPPTPPGT